MAGITPQHPIATASKAQHAEMAKLALVEVYEHAPDTAEVDADFWLQVAGLHSFLSGPMD